MLTNVCCGQSQQVSRGCAYACSKTRNFTTTYRGGLTTHGAPGNRGSWGPCVLTQAQTTPKKAYERCQGYLMGPPTDPGPSGSARVPKWSVRLCSLHE
ncbi:unnamed protein product, partial [Staurois parvus]